MKRREFIRIMGLASGATLMTSCAGGKGKEYLIPYLVPPEEGYVPGEPLFIQTTCTECPAHCGLSVKVLGGYPKKLEGTQCHPINQGKLCVRGQASLTRLYNPERMKQPQRRSSSGAFQAISWKEAFATIIQAMESSRKQGMRNLFLSSRTTGSLSSLIDIFCQQLSVERLPEFECYSHSALRASHRLCFSRDEIPLARIDEADFLLTIGADLFETFVSPVWYANRFALARGKESFFWCHAEPHISLTGLKADRRLNIDPGGEPSLVIFLLQELIGRERDKVPFAGEIQRSLPDLTLETAASMTGLPPEDLVMIAGSFLKARLPVMIAGGVSCAHANGMETAVLTALLQWTSGMIPERIDFFGGENYSHVGSYLDIQHLSDRLRDHEVGTIFILRTNPLRDVPPSLMLKDSLGQARFRVGIADFMDETMKICDIVLPLSHSLESWGDGEPRKNLQTLVQPILKPLFDTKSDGDILLQLLHESGLSHEWDTYQKYLWNQWTSRHGTSFPESFLKAGYYEEEKEKGAISVNIKEIVPFLKKNISLRSLSKPALVMVPSIRTFDGSSLPLPLLTEIPDPLTTITYGRWCSLSEETARKNHCFDGDEISLSLSEGSFKLPVKIQPGLPDNIFMVQKPALDPPPMEIVAGTGELSCYSPLLGISRTGMTVSIPIMSGSKSKVGIGIIADPIHRPGYSRSKGENMYPEPAYTHYRWAMAIDSDLCTGCSACVAACYIENNVPVVGRIEHLRGREMSWIRIEPQYRSGENTIFIPMLCQHCDYAPCETVCPVYAAYHNPEGINAQIYNRCVGTRYCSNNCPYKVRRFNWFDHVWPPPLDKMLNHELYVRGRGIMEKCTFCIQRIRRAKDIAEDESRNVREGDVIPACVQTCPTGALVFGNLLDTASKVYEMAHSERAFRIFDSLGTGPGVYYLWGRKIALSRQPARAKDAARAGDTRKG